jgi:ABC-2 type transport system ATP-binding protein
MMSPSNDQGILVEVRNLKKSFQPNFWQKSKVILDDLSFRLEKQKVYGFLGVNGAGKTTTLKCLLKFAFPDSGVISFDPNVSSIGYMPERPYYYDFLTATEFLKFHWDLLSRQGDFETELNELLLKVQLNDVKDKRLRFFSKGMLQRIGLAQALMGHPSFLIFDEPMSGLDPHGRLLFRKIFLEQKQKGATILFTTHLLSDVEEVCDHLLIIDRGRFVFQGSVVDFKKESSLEQAFLELRERLENDRS